jgi:quercetin dioxygenase-like cupin family protein
MKTTRIMAVAVLIVVSGLTLHVAQSQQTGIKRTDLQRHDLSAPGFEVIQVRVDFTPGAAFPPHSHPGEEIAYVIEGLLEYQVDGQPPVTLKAGEVLFIPAGKIHAAKNVGGGNAASWPRTSSKKGSRSSC